MQNDLSQSLLFYCYMHKDVKGTRGDVIQSAVTFLIVKVRQEYTFLDL